MIKAYKTELKLTKEQERKVRADQGVLRFLYNAYIAYNQERHKLSQKGEFPKGEKVFVSGNNFDKYVNNVLANEKPWIKNVGAKARKRVILSAEGAYKRFMRGEGGFPRWKKRSGEQPGIYFPKNNENDLKTWWHKIMVPTYKHLRLKEFGYLPVTGSGDEFSAINVVIKSNAGRYYLSLTVEIDEKSCYNRDLEGAYVHKEGGLGIDLGVKDLAILSDGEMFENINKSKEVRWLDKKLRREQRRLSRKILAKKKRGKCASAQNLDKQRRKVQKVYQRIQNIRENHENQVVAAIVRKNPKFVTLEDLCVKWMLKNRHLSRHVAAERFSTFRSKLERKCANRGIEVRVVSRFYPSSKLCHECGWKYAELKLKEREWTCQSCGHHHDRDLNAALNLRDATEFSLVEA